jgi:hypothetical protein
MYEGSVGRRVVEMEERIIVDKIIEFERST